MLVQSAGQAAELIAEVPRLALAEKRLYHGTPLEGDEDLVPRPGKWLSLPACVPDADLREIRRDTEGRRFCPRVELEPENAEAASIAFLAIGNGQSADPLLPAWLDAKFEGRDPDDRLRVLDRAMTAKGSRQVQELLHPKPEPQKGRR